MLGTGSGGANKRDCKFKNKPNTNQEEIEQIFTENDIYSMDFQLFPTAERSTTPFHNLLSTNNQLSSIHSANPPKDSKSNHSKPNKPNENDPPLPGKDVNRKPQAHHQPNGNSLATSLPHESSKSDSTSSTVPLIPSGSFFPLSLPLFPFLLFHSSHVFLFLPLIKGILIIKRKNQAKGMIIIPNLKLPLPLLPLLLLLHPVSLPPPLLPLSLPPIRSTVPFFFPSSILISSLFLPFPPILPFPFYPYLLSFPSIHSFPSLLISSLSLLSLSLLFPFHSLLFSPFPFILITSLSLPFPAILSFPFHPYLFSFPCIHSYSPLSLPFYPYPLLISLPTYLPSFLFFFVLILPRPPSWLE